MHWGLSSCPLNMKCWPARTTSASFFAYRLERCTKSFQPLASATKRHLTAWQKYELFICYTTSIHLLLFFSTQFLFFITLHNPHFRVKLCVHFLFFLPVIFMANWRLYSSLIGDCYHLDSLSVWTCEGVGDLFACFISLGFHGTSVRARWFSLYTHPVSSVVEFLAH